MSDPVERSLPNNEKPDPVPETAENENELDRVAEVANTGNAIDSGQSARTAADPKSDGSDQKKPKAKKK